MAGNAKVVNHYLGIDLGTSATKALVLREDGEVVSKASAGYPVIHPKVGWAEQALEAWWQAVGTATKEALSTVDADLIRGIGLSGQLNALVLLDGSKRPLKDAVIWLDQRAVAEANWLNEHYGTRLREAVLNPANPIYVGAKLLWMRNHAPDTLERTRWVLFAKDYINFRLTGEIATDYTDASCSLLFDLTQNRWLVEVLQEVGIHIEQLPPLHSSVEVIGAVTAEAAEATGLPAGLPVVAGAGDVAALALGSGAIEPGVGSITLGTAGHVVMASRAISNVGFGAIWQMRHVDPNRFLSLGLVMSGGLSYAWFKRELGEYEEHRAAETGEDPFELLTARALHSEPGARGLLFLPFLEGVATPHQNPRLKAAFINMSSAHQKGDMVQAVLEGVAFNIRDCIELLAHSKTDVSELRLGEGGSRNPHWRQIIADVLGYPLYPLRESDASAIGAAILAMKAAMPEKSLVEIVEKAVRVNAADLIEPQQK
ncbi:MAG: xylulokinase, partial [Thermosphaera sp.]